MQKFIRKTLFFSVIILLVSACKSDKKETIDFPEIIERGHLNAITSYSPFSYFIYHGEPMGYEYELLQMLGEQLDIPVNIILAKDFEDMEQMLKEGEGDIIAYSLTITSERRERLAFTKPMNVTRQVLVQRKPDNWRQMRLHEIEAQLIRSPAELKDKTLHVRRGSAYVSRLRNLSTEIGQDINIVEAPPGVTTEELIRLVAKDSIEYTVSDENIAQIQSAYYRNIDVETPVSLPQQTAWAVRHSSPLLLDTINSWLEKVQKEADYYVIYNKYYKNRRNFLRRYTSDYFPITGDAISPYDDMFREGAERLGWDWRLLAALAFRESKFDSRARSWAGAAGLMQLMPRTARQFGADNPYEPHQSVDAAVNYLLWLEDYWKEHIEDEKERKIFLIASYNAGHGHIQDARRLADAYYADPNVWEDNVERFIIKKSSPEFYNMDIVRFGYANGIEPVTYVNTVFELYEHYKKFVE